MKTSSVRSACVLVNSVLLPLLGLLTPLSTQAALPFVTDRVDLAPGADAFYADHFVWNGRTNRFYLFQLPIIFSPKPVPSAAATTAPRLTRAEVDLFGPGGGYALGVVDATTRQVIAGIDLGPDFTPRVLAVDDGEGALGNRIYILGIRGSPKTGTPVLRIVDCATNTVLPFGDDTAPLAGLAGRQPVTLAVHPGSHKIYVADDSGYIVVLTATSAGAQPSPTAITTPTSTPGLLVDPARDRVFVIGSGSSTDSAPQVTVLDSARDAVLDTWPLPFAGSITLDSAANRLYLLGHAAEGGTGRRIGVLDATTGALLRTLSAPASARSMTVDPRSGALYLSTLLYDPQSGAPAAGSAIYRVDPETGEARALLARRTYGLRFNPSDERLYFLDDFWTNTLGIFSPVSGEFARVVFAFMPDTLAVDGTRGLVYVTDERADVLSVLDADRHAILARVPVPRFNKDAVYDGRPIAVSERTGRVFLTHTEAHDYTQGTVKSFLDVVEPDGSVRIVPLADGPLDYSRGLALDDTRERLYLRGVSLLLNGSGAQAAPAPTLLVLNARMLATAASFTSSDYNGGGPTVDPGTGHLFFTRGNGDNADGAVNVFDGATGAMLASVGVGPRPGPIAVDASAGKVFVGSSLGVGKANRITVIDSRSNAAERVLEVPQQPGAPSNVENRLFTLAVDEAAHTLYALDEGSFLTVFSSTDGRFLGQLQPDATATLAVDAVRHQLFTSRMFDGSVNVLRTDALPSFFDTQITVGGGFYYLPSFGYYYLGFFPYVYHLDLGFLYCIDGRDAGRGTYFYDFGNTRGSLGFFYTSPTLFPYLYVFSARAWFYYFPDANAPGRYTHDPRVFFNFATGQFVSE